jgi:hypothetical protein
MTTELFIHVGIRKSATTWLQSRVFPRLSGVNYLGKTEALYPKWLLDWHYLDDFAFEDARAQLSSELAGELRPGINLISSEAFTNTGVIWQQAHRIAALWPAARIIVTLRDPLEVILSHYRLDVMDGIHVRPLEECLDWSRTPYDLMKRRPIYLPDLFFGEMVGLYQRLFGANRVQVLRYERLKSDPSGFVNQLVEFVGCTVDSQSVMHAAAVRANASAPDEVVQRARARNAFRLMQDAFPRGAAAIDQVALEADALRNPVMDGALRLRLIGYFKGRCHGYFE